MKVLPITVARPLLIGLAAAGLAWWIIRTTAGPPLPPEVLNEATPPGASRRGASVIGNAPGVFPEWGLVLSQTDDGIVYVSKVLPYFPAARGGILVGDVLISVNRKTVKGMGLEDIAHRIAPKPPWDVTGSSTDLVLSRSGMEYRTRLPRGVQTMPAAAPRVRPSGDASLRARAVAIQI